MSYIYAHGELQDILNYDLIMNDDEKLDKLIKNPEADKVILSLELEDETMKVHSVKAFLWKNELTKYYMGLICLEDDVEYITDAEQKYHSMKQNI